HGLWGALAHHMPRSTSTGTLFSIRERLSECSRVASLRPMRFSLSKFRRPEDRIGDVHEGPCRQHSHVEGQLHSNFHDFRSGEAETQCPFDHPTDGHVVLSPYN